jgi:hypothetical protein
MFKKIFNSIYTSNLPTLKENVDLEETYGRLSSEILDDIRKSRFTAIAGSEKEIKNI